MREDTRAPGTGRPTGESPPPAVGFPVFAVREWAARLYEQERLKRESTWWRLSWPFLLALALGAAAVRIAWSWPVREVDLALGGTVVLAAVAVGVALGGLFRARAVRARLAVAAKRPATVESLPASARAAVLATPRLRFRWPVDGPSFTAARDGVLALAPLGDFAASVVVWALTVDGRVDGTLEDWVHGRAG